MGERVSRWARTPCAGWVILFTLLAACSGGLESEDFAAGGDGGDDFGGGGQDGGPGGMVAQSDGSGGTSGSGGQDNQGLGGTHAGQGGHGGSVIDPPPGTIPMFVAQGEAGRTLVSCDDGRSWVADQSDHGWQYCNNNDCDHHGGAGRGVIWAEGWFVLTFGWGSPGSIRRSRDGVSWESVLDAGTFGGIAFGNGRLLAAHKYGRYSDDLGETWNEADVASVTGRNVRATAFVSHDRGLFLIAASSSSTSEIVYGTDGIHFQAPESLPASCAEGIRLPGRIVYGNGAIVTVGDDGVICRSTDGGRTWTARSISNRLRGGAVWTGSEFMTWDRGTVFRSTDGDTWTPTDTVPSDVDVGVVAISDSGTFASITAGYKQEYEGQLAYRSEDGIRWEVLSDDAFSKGHPMRAMTFGYGLPSVDCP